jgi:phospho-N-acetylmuramoyl-pentapeptide-transferase
MTIIDSVRYVFFMVLGGILLQHVWIWMLQKRSVSQHIKAYGPPRHLKEKKNIPTMGGVVFLVLLSVGALLFFRHTTGDLVAILFFPLGMGCIGFIDDWLKHAAKSSEGFGSFQKFFAQIFLCSLWIFFVYQNRPYIFIPFSPVLDVATTLFLGVGIVNAVNITDGLDGLASLCSLGSFVVLGIVALLTAGETSLFLAATGIAITLGFLWHNCYPASIFMGDVGSHFLGGLLFVASVFFENPWILLPLSSIFAVEIFSVILQLIAIHGFHRKIFAMSPLHHHFELQGVRETHIVIRFLTVHLLCMMSFFMLWKTFVS